MSKIEFVLLRETYSYTAVLLVLVFDFEHTIYVVIIEVKIYGPDFLGKVRKSLVLVTKPLSFKLFIKCSTSTHHGFLLNVCSLAKAL